MIRWKYPVMLAVLLFLLTACKPTENNYKAAYDAAKQKREKALSDDLIPEGGLLQDDGTRPYVLPDGRRVSFLREPVKEMTDGVEPKKYYVVVASFKMRANASGLLSRLKDSDATPVLLRQTDEKWYVAAAGFNDLQEAGAYAGRYLTKHPGAEQYIGLEGTPLILESSRWRPTK